MPLYKRLELQSTFIPQLKCQGAVYLQLQKLVLRCHEYVLEGRTEENDAWCESKKMNKSYAWREKRATTKRDKEELAWEPSVGGTFTAMRFYWLCTTCRQRYGISAV